MYLRDARRFGTFRHGSIAISPQSVLTTSLMLMTCLIVENAAGDPFLPFFFFQIPRVLRAFFFFCVIFIVRLGEGLAL